METPITDQWLLDGDCKQCRRAGYCNKDCVAFKCRKKKKIQSTMVNMMLNFIDFAEKKVNK